MFVESPGSAAKILAFKQILLSFAAWFPTKGQNQENSASVARFAHKPIWSTSWDVKPLPVTKGSKGVNLGSYPKNGDAGGDCYWEGSTPKRIYLLLYLVEKNWTCWDWCCFWKGSHHEILTGFWIRHTSWSFFERVCVLVGSTTTK